MDLTRPEIYVYVQKVGLYSYWHDQFLSGIKAEAIKRDYPIIILDEENFDKVIINCPKNWPVIVTGYAKKWLKLSVEKVTAAGLRPIVCSPPENISNCNGVRFELKECMCDVVDYLLWCGRRNIAFLGCNPSSVADGIKQNTFIKHCLQRNIKVFDNYPCVESLMTCVDDFLKVLKRINYNAVICANDTVAVYFIELAEKQGLSVPNDVYVVGMGNTAIGKQLKIPLTSVGFDYYEMGKQAINIFRFMRKNTSEAHFMVSLPCPIIVRTSTECKNPGTEFYHKEKIENDQETYGGYFEDTNISKIVFSEAFLQECDEIDRQIVVMLSENKTYEEMAEVLRVSDRAIRYRVMKMMTRFNVKSKRELSAYMRQMLSVSELN